VTRASFTGVEEVVPKPLKLCRCRLLGRTTFVSALAGFLFAASCGCPGIADGRKLFSEGRFGEAVAMLSRTVQSTRCDTIELAEANYLLGDCYARLGNADAAHEAIDNGKQLVSKALEAVFLRGNDIRMEISALSSDAEVAKRQDRMKQAALYGNAGDIRAALGHANNRLLRVHDLEQEYKRLQDEAEQLNLLAKKLDQWRVLP
jgi:hypothetical protein